MDMPKYKYDEVKIEIWYLSYDLNITIVKSIGVLIKGDFGRTIQHKKSHILNKIDGKVKNIRIYLDFI